MINKKMPGKGMMLSLLAVAFCLIALPTRALEGGLVRDAEIENALREWGIPIFRAADLDPEAVQLYILDTPTINAFVAGGQNIFFTTGLLMRSESVGQVIGVLAHETGHIAGGHLARTEKELSHANVTSMIAMVLGAGAMAAGGGEAGSAIFSGGQHVAERQFLHYSRSQENAADQAALSYLETTGQSAHGFADFFKIIEREHKIATADTVPYATTHPLTKDRLKSLDHHLSTSPYTDKVPPPSVAEAHARIRAKLFGFLKPLAEVLREYPSQDNTIAARYARAIAYYRLRDLDRALPLTESLLGDEPDNPYFHELKGQMLFENGRAAEAVPAYREAVALLPQSALLRIGLAQALTQFNRPDLNQEAIETLRKALDAETENPTAWHLIGAAYGRAGQGGLASLSLAEKFLLTGHKQDALRHAEKALQQIEENSPNWYRAYDIVALLKTNG